MLSLMWLFRFYVTNIAVHIVTMVMMVGVNRNIFRKLVAEKVNKRRVIRYGFRCACTANMLIYSKHFIGVCHHNM